MHFGLPGTPIGYPAPDSTLREFLLSPTTQEDAYHLYRAFFTALFEQVRTAVRTYVPARSAAIFRAAMSEGQSGISQGPFRRQFYVNVISRAKTLLSGDVSGEF